MVSSVLLALLLALPISQSWFDLGKSTKTQAEPSGVAPIPCFAWIPPKDYSSTWHPPVAAFLNERGGDEWSRRERQDGRGH